ncbi:MAG: hypothetical protein COB36_03365 [Alphaproteobacteria bacterium]|nr:MAG: hypothetical protein COB36_03365 [Alphaproteobacteria bacterium]
MENTISEDTQALNLEDLLSTIARHKVIITFITLLMILISIVYIKTADVIYYASSVVLLEDKNKDLEIKKLTEAGTIDLLYISSEIQVLQSRELVKNVLDKIGVFDDPYLLFPKDKSRKPISDDMLINFVIKNIKIRQIQKSRAIEIGFSSHNREASSTLVNTLAELYITEQISSDKTELSSTNTWLSDRVTQLRYNVKKIDTEIVEYKNKFNIINSNGRALIENEMEQLSKNLIDAQVKLVESQAKSDEINGASSIKTAPEIMKSSMIQKLIERQALNKEKVFELNKEYGVDHPDMISATNRLNSITNKIEQEINKIAKSMEREYKVAQVNVVDIKRQLDALKIEYNKANEYSIKLAVLQREADNSKRLLEKLDVRWKEIQVQEDIQLQTPSAKILSKAVVPNKPQGPNPKVIIIISIIGGVCIGLAVAVSLDYMQTNIYNGNQLQKYTNIPNIALVPRLKGAVNSLVERSVSHLYKNPLSDYAESLRSLTTYLKLHIEKFPSKKIFNFTSVATGDGKSALVATAACQMSLEGLKVLVIDCDLKNPSLGAAFKLHEKKGLSNLLAGTVEFQDVVYKDKDSSIDLIGIGTVQDVNIINKSAKVWKKLLAAVSKEYDIIMLDGPPALNISDMSILAEDSQNIMCVRWKKTSYRQILYSQNLLKSLNFSLLGTVITLVSPKKIKMLNKA